MADAKRIAFTAVAATVRRHRPAKLAFAKVIRYATGDGEMEEGILGN